MSLSRKHFQALADIIRHENKSIARDYADAKAQGTTEPFEHLEGRDRALERMTNALADFCSNHSPNFDRARFLAACEPSCTQHNAT